MTGICGQMVIITWTGILLCVDSPVPSRDGPGGHATPLTPVSRRCGSQLLERRRKEGGKVSARLFWESSGV